MREVYAPRRVNSIYFENCYLRHFYENVDGISSRRKFRVRWYGPLEVSGIAATFEIKARRGALGYKKSARIPSFSYPCVDLVARVTGCCKDLAEECEYFKYLRPIVVTTYWRRYFLSADRDLRVTVDYDIEYLRYREGITGHGVSQPGIVVEFKYDFASGDIDRYLASFLPLTVSKNSKYVNAVNSCIL